MHIIIGFLGSLITVLWLLHRLAEMGVDLGGLNPWLWRRRRNWRSKHDANPVYKIDNPLELTALLVTAMAKADGDMSREDRRFVLSLFESEFRFSPDDASGMLTSSSFLLGDGAAVRENLAAVVQPSKDQFSKDQLTSALDMIERVANSDGEPSLAQQRLLEQLRKVFAKALPQKSTWSE